MALHRRQCPAKVGKVGLPRSKKLGLLGLHCEQNQVRWITSCIF